MARVYCPKCGEEMSRDTDGKLTCPRVGNWLSPRMQALLPRYVEEGSVDAGEGGSSVAWGGGWHCPADGEQMTPGIGSVECPSCRRRLPGKLLYELTEFNPHVRYSGETAN